MEEKTQAPVAENEEIQAPLLVDKAFTSPQQAANPASRFLVSRKFRVILFFVGISVISYAVLIAIR